MGKLESALTIGGATWLSAVPGWSWQLPAAAQVDLEDLVCMLQEGITEFDTACGQMLRRVAIPAAASAIAVCPGGKFAVVASHQDSEGRAALQLLNLHTWALEPVQGGLCIAMSDGCFEQMNDLFVVERERSGRPRQGGGGAGAGGKMQYVHAACKNHSRMAAKRRVTPFDAPTNADITSILTQMHCQCLILNLLALLKHGISALSMKPGESFRVLARCFVLAFDRHHERTGEAQ